MPWSEPTQSARRAVLLGGYGLAAALAAAELAILALALNPNVNNDYRAYYIDKSTTCLNRDAVGRYTPGRTVSFRSDGAREATAMMVCGWSGPVADGTHSLGETSRLRLALPSPPGEGFLATLQMAAVIRPPQLSQRVVISANGVRLHQATLSGPAPTTVTLAIPRAALPDSGMLEIEFDYPDGIAQSPAASNIYNRSIKLISFRLDAL
ncbi:MAG: hypothetical protein E5X49_28685 [Mesorhizobium sp.]|nr:MAG: hypothetical protein EOQ28_29760 [Mesorhizobium sp.]RWB95457.1 MAG: hypothetical protein EOQ57_29000 [Mesorhizobium sp.]RWK05802.1 MAG: hypothetical protein EOR39_26075 [Mesorhizobium sp.]TIQ39266.1 MAG: hypothetical protein E5X49_28685 [Mesorhizobium sp.]TIQ45094.1 MAG: hypothetical protein E5X47_27255 [Mesorhizobium sp.]